jgi:hypothetical protein
MEHQSMMKLYLPMPLTWNWHFGDICIPQTKHKKAPKFKGQMLLKQNVGRGKAFINVFTFYVFMWIGVQFKVDSCIKDT